MKAILFERNGGYDVLKYSDTPEPTAGPNDVVIRVKASACNFNDIWARRGLPGMKIILPHISGSDAAGVVVEIGSEVQSVKVGDEVVVHCGIACRECYHCTRGEEYFCPAFKIWASRPDRSMAHMRNIAGFPPSTSCPNRPTYVRGSRHHAAGTGHGVADADFARTYSGRRFRPGMGRGGRTGRDGAANRQIVQRPCDRGRLERRQLDLCGELGAEFLLQRKKHDIFQEVRKITGSHRADVVFEHTGSDTWPISMQCLKWGGTIVTCGATSGFDAHLDIRLLWNKQQNYLGSHLGNKGELIDAMRFVETGEIKPVVGEVLPLKDLAMAQDLMETNTIAGKIAIVPPAA